MNRKALGFLWLSLCCACLIVMLHAQGKEQVKRSSVEIDRSVIETLSRHGTKKARVISHIDLAEPFQAKSQWTFVAVQEDDPLPEDLDAHGPISVCLVREAAVDCDQLFSEQKDVDEPSFDDTPYRLLAGSVVHIHSDQSSPLFLLKVCGPSAGNGSCKRATALYKYDKRTDRFTRVFFNLTGNNNNEGTRFVESGPLQGDVIVNYPTENAPYTYWIELFRAGDLGKYGQILRYRARTHYGDGNPLAVIDSEMPEILHRLGLWNVGDALPVPPRLPQGCKVLYMRQGQEWCK